MGIIQQFGEYIRDALCLALSRRLSIDVLVSQLNQIVRVNHIGLLVIDELQNIAYRKSDGGIRFLNFLVHLINGAGVSVCMVGTPRVLQVLQQEFRSARRTTGLVYDRLPNDKEFSLLLHGLWHYQYTQYATDLTPELANWLYGIFLIGGSNQTVDLQVNIQYQCFNGRIVRGLHNQVRDLVAVELLPMILSVLNDLRI